MQAALQKVRQELGPDASVLHTREVRSGLMRWLTGNRQIEVTASNQVTVPSRLPERTPVESSGADASDTATAEEWSLDNGYEPTQNALETFTDYYSSQYQSEPAPAETIEPQPELSQIQPVDSEHYRQRYRDDLNSQIADLQSMVADLYERSCEGRETSLPENLFQLFTDLIEADLSEETAREMIEQLRQGVTGNDLDDEVLLRARLVRMVEDEITVSGPIRTTPGQCRVAALVGPTGVGKTTTIAKLAANFRLRDKLRVGLITVDTYRIAAVEQLRTYADIMDLPMEVVSTPQEMREARARLADLDLVLMDTAGRSPRDEVKIQELKSVLAEAEADEVHLVLSGGASGNGLVRAAERFAEAGTTSLIITKLDEAAGLGNLMPLIRQSGLPLSYLTDGQSVPDDIQIASQQRLARMILGMEQA